MKVRTRNRIIRTIHGVALAVPVVIIGWILWQMEEEPRRHFRMKVFIGVFVLLIVVPHLWFTIRMRKLNRDTDRALREAGIDPDSFERPMRLVPRLPLAKDRDQLIAGILFFVLLVGVFMAYYARWFGSW